MRFLLTALTCSGLFLAPNLWGNLQYLFASIPPATAGVKHLVASTNVEEVARQITVRIFQEGESGSGAVVARHGQTYTVITNSHVLGEAQSYPLMTADGVTHNARRQSCDCFAGLDLAFLTFESPNNYRVAELASSEVSSGASLYAAGFPGYFYPNNSEIQSTESWGVKALEISQGTAALLMDKPLLQGYQLGYTNEVKEGMSGGPVLNREGKLVAINGRLKYPLQGISAYIFDDGTQPSPALFSRMEALSWAIPLNSFRQEIENIN